MRATTPSNRRKVFGLDFHVASAIVPGFYMPLVAAALRAQGWHREVAFGSGLLFALVWLCVIVIVNGLFVPRFAKLRHTLQFLVLGLPLLGAVGIMVWMIIRAVWHQMR